MIYGYARVSSKGQEKYGNGLEVQVKSLKDYGCETIYSEAFTGTKRHRPELDKLLISLKPGDTVVVHKLDRIARSTKEGIEIVDEIVGKGCTLNILNMGVFDNSPMGKMIRTMLLAFSEFEHDLILQRMNDGKEIARQNPSWREGRKSKEIPKEYKDLVNSGKMSVNEACKILNVGRSTWYRHQVG